MIIKNSVLARLQRYAWRSEPLNFSASHWRTEFRVVAGEVADTERKAYRFEAAES